MSFTSQGRGDGRRPPRIGFFVMAALALTVGTLGAVPGLLRRFALFRGRQLHAGAAGFGKPDRNRLFRRAGPVFARADVFHRLADEFTRLGGWGFPLALGLPSSFDGLLLRHVSSPRIGTSLVRKGRAAVANRVALPRFRLS